MGNWKAIFPILLSLVIAVAGSFLAYQWIQKKTAPKEMVRVESDAVPVAVAAIDIPWGTKLTPEMLKKNPYLKESLPNGYFSDVALLKDRVTVSPLKPGDPVVEHRLAPVDIKTGGVSAVLSTGKRAVAVKGDKVIGISGLINPGNRVDVLVTMQDPETEKKLDKTKIVLENILVLATGTQIQKNEKGEPAPVDVYALEVTPEESEKLALAAAQGKLQFALRNQLDFENILTRGTTISQTLASLMLNAPQAPEPKPVKIEKKAERRSTWAPRRAVTVEMIRGTEMTKNTSSLK
ncbi:MAG: Flp pilus assembly protein CpaB [Desulfobacterales bacterium]|jgi:pilus assembly protein CpaB|nr:Flp pilus assembly protein CpaB [Desulfobacterales bacterium]